MNKDVSARRAARGIFFSPLCETPPKEDGRVGIDDWAARFAQTRVPLPPAVRRGHIPDPIEKDALAPTKAHEDPYFCA